MSTRKKHQTSELRPNTLLTNSKPVKVTTTFEPPSTRNIDVEQAAMAQGMQEWFDSFNKSHKVKEDEGEE